MNAIQELVPPGVRVADLMCGTASVSEALRVAGYQVISTDIMTYSFYHATVRLMIAEAPRFCGLGGRSYLDVLNELQHVHPVEGLMVREYSPAGKPLGGYPPRGYLSPANAARIDSINLRLSTWEQEGRLTQKERALLRHDLVLAVNRVANIAGTYGHFRSKWSNGSMSPLQLVPSEFSGENSSGHAVLQGRAEDLARSISADLCYIDPPYTKRQYAANYHLLETVARGDTPKAIGVSGLRPWRDQYSNFCSKLLVRDSFCAIIKSMDCPRFLISYSEDGLLSKEDLGDLLSGFGKVQTQEYPYPRFRSNDSPLAPTGTEFIFYLERS